VAAQCKNLAHTGFVEVAEALSALATGKIDAKMPETAKS
jgi:hypothetical protein